ncbi:Tripartite DNA replication factor [Tulasnella sp. JGI-2019a]|nr:Tripartite DNA replication factor [Tulasnella sp. JGI-2019a]
MATSLTKAEQKMMDDLLSGLDDCISDYNPTPVKKETSTRFSLSPCALRSNPIKEEAPSPLRFNTVKKEALSPLRFDPVKEEARSPLRLNPVKKEARSPLPAKRTKHETVSPLRTVKGTAIRKHSTPSLVTMKRIKVSQSPLSKSRLWPDTKGKGKENQPPTPRRLKAKQDMDALMEGLGDSDWDDMEEEASQSILEVGATQTPTRLPVRVTYLTPPKPSAASLYVPDPCTRCVVLSVDELEPGRYQLEKHLIVRVDRGGKPKDTDEKRLVILKDDWVLTNVRSGDTINIIGHFAIKRSTIQASSSSVTIASSITITALKNIIILHPDLLLTSTSISSTSQCARKPLISSLLHSPFNVTEASTWGTMLHEVMQACLSEGRWDKPFIEERTDQAVRGGLGELLRISIGVEKAKEEVRTKAVGIEKFSSKFIGDAPKPEAELSDLTSSSKALLALTGLHDIEEDIWSPTYGFKGKIDASVQATIKETDLKLKRTKETTWTMPFEIKTGRVNTGLEARAQTMLYTVLMAERYGTETPAGLLYYTQSESLIRVTASRHDLRGLIISRNNTASYMMRRRASKDGDDREDTGVLDDSDLPKRSAAQSTIPAVAPVREMEDFLPPTIDQEYTCKKCYASDGCMLYRKAIEGIDDTSSDIADLYDAKTSHLTPERSSFFKSWENLLSLEEQDMIRFRKELWTMTAEKREKTGRCFSNMVLDSYEPQLGPGVAAMNRHIYRFARAASYVPTPTATSASGVSEKDHSLLSGHISKNDAVTVSIEPHLLALARGFVMDLTPTHIIIGFDKAINVDGVLARTHPSVRTPEPSLLAPPPTIYRIDRDEMSSGMSRIRHNLANLFFVDGDTKRLELVVDLKSPSFDANHYLDPLPARVAQAGLNPSQVMAMGKVLQARDYALILGMPGTGKTTTVAEIIKELVRRGKTVLLTSYTHSAVDTILLKLVDAGFDMLRLGHVDKVHPDVRKFTLGEKNVPSTLEQLEHQLFSPPVVATTCLSVDHALFSRRTFDYCIVDEASQITLPTCLGPLRFADKFVLVGDHFQLPPLVRSHGARKGGLDVSLFRRLSDAHPHAVTDLTYQYRMNADIMLLSNKLIYGDRLICGSKEVAERTLRIPNPNGMRQLHLRGPRDPAACGNGQCWIESLLDEGCKAVFVDTDSVPARDSRVGDLVQNEVEADLIHQVSEALLSTGVLPSQIGIISPYRQQIKLLTHLFRNTEAEQEIEILTADRSQGRDKDCILMSMVRSNDEGQVGDLLRDWRRMNVSLTRAKAKLIVFGSRSTLQGVPLWNEFFGLMEERGWIVRLPRGANKIHEKVVAPAACGKRRAAEDEDVKPVRTGKENATPRKKVKTEGVLKGRFILQDLINAS